MDFHTLTFININHSWTTIILYQPKLSVNKVTSLSQSFMDYYTLSA